MAVPLPHILIVDDDPLIRTSLYEVLRQEGYPVQMAEDGQEALSRFERETFSIVVADLRMPRMDGIQLLKQLRERYQAPPLLPLPMPGGCLQVPIFLL